MTSLATQAPPKPSDYLNDCLPVSRGNAIRLNFALGFLALLIGYVFALSANAASFIIADDETQTDGQELVAVGDTGTVQSGAAITTIAVAVDDDGITVTETADNAVVTIEAGGLISTMAEQASGVFSLGDDVTISNSGTIMTAGRTVVTGGLLQRNSGSGIDSRGLRARITNSGMLTTTGQNAYGIIVFGADSEVVNHGIITTTGATSAGIASPSQNVRITNHGTITTQSSAAWGIVSRGQNAMLANHGKIMTVGSEAHGILSERFDANIDAASATITNAGVIQTSGAGAHGIQVDHDSGATITVSGAIMVSGDGAMAIVEGELAILC